MSLQFGEIQFERPWMVAGALILIPWCLARWRSWRRDRVPLSPIQLAPRASARSWARGSRLAAECLVIAGVILALAGPYTTRTIERIDDAGIDVVLVLDVSLSMLAEDFEPNRLAVLRRIASEFLARRASDRFSLVIFGKDTFVQSPLTTDDLILQRLLEGVRVDAIDQHLSGGTAIGDALLVAADQLRSARITGRDQSVLLITDGESNEGIDPVLAGRFVRDQGLDFFAIGVGGREPVEVYRDGRRIGDELLTALDDATLERLAEAAGGRYFRAADEGSLETIFALLSRLQSAPLKRRSIERRSPLASTVAACLVPVFALALACAGFARRPLR